MRQAFRRLFAAALAAGTILAAVPASVAQDGLDVPPFRTRLGVRFAEGPGPGVALAEVNPGSPAERADLKPGDRILSVNGRPVDSPASAVSYIATFPPHDAIELVLEREGTRLVRRVILSGWLRYEPSAGPRTFPVPGVDTGDEEIPPDPIAGLDRMNVLKRVLIDRRSGRVEFLGTYDPRFATGAVPYRQLLDEALLYPDPAFSLDPHPQALADYSAAAAKKRADFDSLFSFGTEPCQLQSAKLAEWVRNWLGEIETNPLLEPDRQAFLGRYARACGLTQGELASLFNYNRLYGVRDPVPPVLLAVQIKLLKNLGYTAEARSYELYRKGSADDLGEALRGLGKEAQAREALARPFAVPAKAGSSLDRMKAYFCAEMLFVISRSQRGGQTLWDDFAAGRKDLATLDRDLQWAIWPEYDRTGKSLIFQALGGVPLSNELIRMVYGVFPGLVKLRFEGLPASSALARILYASDYALKTIDISEDLAPAVAGHRNAADFAAEFPVYGTYLNVVTLVPREVPFYVSGSGKEIAFGESRIGLDSSVLAFPGAAPLTPEALAAAKTRGLAWAGQVGERYDDYAHVHPALHSLREAAKVLALARWIRGEKITVSPGAAIVPAWDPPAEVPGTYDVRISFKPVPSPDGKPRYVLEMPMTLQGGVDFRTKKDWSMIGPRPPSYAPIEDQLTTSAALGENAVQAALAGDLERARALAELSAQALTGDLDLARVPAGVSLQPSSSRAAGTPDDARLVKESLKALRSLTGGDRPASGEASSLDTALLADIGEAFRRGGSDQASASAFLTRLQTRRTGPSGDRGVPIAPTDKAGAPAEAFDCAAFLSELEADAPGDDARKAFLESRLAEIQSKMEAVRKSLEELSRLRRGDLQALQACEQKISQAYEDAQDRALDAASMLLVDAPLEILQARREAMKAGVEQGLKRVLFSRSGALDGAAVAALDRQAYDHFRLGYSMEDIFGKTERLHKTLTGAKSLYDMAGWADSDKSDFEKLKAGSLQLVEMLLGDDRVGGALKLGKLTGKAALRFLSLYKAADAAVGFLGDIVAQKLAWAPLVDELVRSLETNRRAVQSLQEKARDLQNKINCLRSGMR
ncbi:MAG TPA: PDZ domain-containing protein [Candidatus Bathyarchaeia archaeon]|nr:PDZ domain-containing protein [Candidatus Bathyarchaeia archaeon]